MSDKWKKPEQPPPPLFLGEKERNLVKQVNDELIEKVIGQQILYYSIDLRSTQFHELYGEAIEKTFLPPVRVYALVEYTSFETEYMDNFGIDKTWEINIHFHKRRVEEDQDLYVREGDFVLYNDYYYEITKLDESKLLFGQKNQEFEIAARCRRARRGLFDAT